MDGHALIILKIYGKINLMELNYGAVAWTVTAYSCWLKSVGVGGVV